MMCTSYLWILALFITSTEWGPGNGFVDGITQFLTNSLNNSVLYESCMISHSIKSFIVYRGRIFHFSDRFNGCVYTAGVSMGDHPNFRFIVCSFAADSFINIICSDVHSIKRIIHSSLSSLFHCKAWRWS